MNKEDYIHCRLCSWKTPRFRKNKKGQIKNGHGLLDNHFSSRHQDVWLDLQDRLVEEYRDRE